MAYFRCGRKALFYKAFKRVFFHNFRINGNTSHFLRQLIFFAFKLNRFGRIISKEFMADAVKDLTYF